MHYTKKKNSKKCTCHIFIAIYHSKTIKNKLHNGVVNFACKIASLYINIYMYVCIYKWLRILSRHCFCRDPEFRSTMETSSVDDELLVLPSKNRFLCIQCPKISVFLFKDGADLRMESFSCKQSLHILSLGFTFLTTSHLILKLMFLFF